MRHHVPIRLRWADLDAYNHVNNSTMLTLLEESRVRAFWASPGVGDGPEPDRPLAVIDAAAGARTLTLIARNEVEYLAPIPYQPEPLDVQLWFGKLGAASAEVCYEVWSPVGPPESERTRYTIAASTIVFIDAETSRPRRMSDAEREAWTPFVEEPVRFRGARGA